MDTTADTLHLPLISHDDNTDLVVLEADDSASKEMGRYSSMHRQRELSISLFQMKHSYLYLLTANLV
jgi:transketolase C-terminal domain/subunit